MKLQIAVAFAAASLAGAAFAQDGDAAAGEKAFNRCKACHSIVDDSGEAIVKGGKVGPNLYGVVGRVAGSLEDFRYSEAMMHAHEQGLVWDWDHFSHYVPDPTSWLKEATNDDGARGAMAAQRVKDEDLANIWAYLVSVSPAVEGAEGTATN